MSTSFPVAVLTTQPVPYWSQRALAAVDRGGESTGGLVRRKTKHDVSEHTHLFPSLGQCILNPLSPSQRLPAVVCSSRVARAHLTVIQTRGITCVRLQGESRAERSIREDVPAGELTVARS